MPIVYDEKLVNLMNEISQLIDNLLTASLKSDENLQKTPDHTRSEKTSYRNAPTIKKLKPLPSLYEKLYQKEDVESVFNILIRMFPITAEEINSQKSPTKTPTVTHHSLEKFTKSLLDYYYSTIPSEDLPTPLSLFFEYFIEKIKEHFINCTDQPIKNLQDEECIRLSIPNFLSLWANKLMKITDFFEALKKQVQEAQIQLKFSEIPNLFFQSRKIISEIHYELKPDDFEPPSRKNEGTYTSHPSSLNSVRNAEISEYLSSINKLCFVLKKAFPLGTESVQLHNPRKVANNNNKIESFARDLLNTYYSIPDVKTFFQSPSDFFEDFINAFKQQFFDDTSKSMGKYEEQYARLTILPLLKFFVSEHTPIGEETDFLIRIKKMADDKRNSPYFNNSKSLAFQYYTAISKLHQKSSYPHPQKYQTFTNSHHLKNNTQNITSNKITPSYSV